MVVMVDKAAELGDRSNQKFWSGDKDPEMGWTSGLCLDLS